MIRALLTLTALPIVAACDPIGFAMRNDTARPVEVKHGFTNAEARCHTPEYMGGEVQIAAQKNLAFRCPANEISYIELTQSNRSCRVNRLDLVTMGGELKASDCFADVRFSGRRSPP
jgi:hypothetical protein